MKLTFTLTGSTRKDIIRRARSYIAEYLEVDDSEIDELTDVQIDVEETTATVYVRIK